MINLPTEVLQMVFSLFAQRDKLECMTVCKRWNDLLHRDLFRVIYIHSDKQLDRLTERIERDPMLGTKVERLSIELSTIKYFNKPVLLEFLPNLCEFAIKTPKYVRLETTTSESVQDHPWRKHLEKIVENNNALNTKPLLQASLCEKLTNIFLKGEGQTPTSLFELFGNAPALKILNLNSYTISFRDLELLHERTPLLDSLLLKNVDLDATTIPRDVKPATLVRNFHWTSSRFDSPDIPNPHLWYISQKYTHLEELGLSFDWIDSDDMDDVILLEQQRIVIASYMKTLGTRLKTFIIDIEDFSDLVSSSSFDFAILDECGCQIENLKLSDSIDTALLERLSETNQVQYIQSLTLNEWFDFHHPYITLTWLRGFKVLKELALYSPIMFQLPERRELNLTDLLDVLGENQLETLRLYGIQLTFDSSSRIQAYPSLKELTLSNVAFQVGTDVFLSRVFPNLKRLKLEDCFKNGETFMFPDIDFSYIEVINTSVNETFPIKVVTRDGKQPRLYNATAKPYFYEYDDGYEQKDIFNLPYISSQSFDKSEGSPALTIECKSLYNFVMMNCKR